MSELLLTLLRLGFLVLLWVLVLSVIGVLRTDIYGTRLVARGAGQRAPTRPPKPGQRAHAQGQQRPAPPPPQLPTRIDIVAGPAAGRSLNLDRSAVTIGRSSDCTFVLDDDFASSRHARITRAPEGWVLEDLGSTNGTRVNGAPVESPVLLPPGSSVQIGKTMLELRR